jgi:hypothetical protein
VGKGKRIDVYLEVRKRGIYFLNETSACGNIPPPPLNMFCSQQFDAFIYEWVGFLILVNI